MDQVQYRFRMLVHLRVNKGCSQLITDQSGIPTQRCGFIIYSIASAVRLSVVTDRVGAVCAILFDQRNLRCISNSLMLETYNK